jgi:hypothetical protein
MGREPEPRGKMAFLVAPSSPHVMGFRLGPSDFPSTVPQLALHTATFVGELCMYLRTFSVCDPGGLTPGGGVVLGNDFIYCYIYFYKYFYKFPFPWLRWFESALLFV